MEEDWEILELTGPFSAVAVHSPTGSLVYSLGTIIVIWDVISDKKINLRCHTSPVTSISFSTDNEYFITVECSSQPMVCLWRWRNFEQISAKWLPFKPRSQNLLSLHSSFVHRKVVICEGEADGGYRVSLWEYSDNHLHLQIVEELELNELCLGVCILNDQTQFACLEPNCLKLWSLESFTISKRLHFKNKVNSLDYCRSHGVFALLLENKSVIVLNQSGKTLALIPNSAHLFTAVTSSQEHLYLATSDGNVLIYNLRSFTVFKELPSTHSSGIKAIKVNIGNLVYVLFEDSTVQVLNLAEGQVANQSSGHCTSVLSAVWADKLNFYSCSDEGCLYVWKYYGKGWNMQAMDVSGGKGELSALSAHPSHRVLACGFNKGFIKIFQTGDKPRFLNSIQFDNSPINYLEYSHCGSYLAVMHENGYSIILNHSYELISELEQAKSRPILFLTMHEVFSSHGSHLLVATTREEYLLTLHVFKTSKNGLEKVDEKSLEIEGTCTGIQFHCSGNYLACTSSAGGIYIFHTESGDVSGVILCEKSSVGCVIDPSGLYVGTFAESSIGVNNRFAVFEIGTGKKASELGRLENVSVNAVKWSHDGRYLLIGSLSGVLTVWRLPKVFIGSIHEMLSSMQTNPFIWQDYPIELANKTLPRIRDTRKNKEVIVTVGDDRKERGAFVDSVVALVKRPERPHKERSQSKQPIRMSKLDLPDRSPSRGYPINDTPVSLTKDLRPTVKPKIHDFYGKKSKTTGKAEKKQEKYIFPSVVKSTLIATSKSIESIDVECSANSRNPVHRLYEKFESYGSEDSESRYN